MMEKEHVLNNEDGSVLIIALVMLVLLTIVGISASTNTSIELQVAGNEKFHKMAFYAADGGTEAGIELLEQNIESRGFVAPVVGYTPLGDGSLEFYANTDESVVTKPTAGNFDIHVPNIGDGNVYMRVFGSSELSTGSALQLAAGYEGKGKALGGGGAYIVYSIRSFAAGPANSQARVTLLWRHLI